MPKIPAISLARYYAQLRSVPGQNWAALALQQVESTTNQIIAHLNTPAATTTATTKTGGGGGGGGGGAGSGITQLTGDVAAGPGSGAVAATIAAPGTKLAATLNAAPSAPGNFTIAHGLSAAPSRIEILPTSNPLTAAIWAQTPAFDATNVYLAASLAGATAQIAVFA